MKRTEKLSNSSTFDDPNFENDDSFRLSSSLRFRNNLHNEDSSIYLSNTTGRVKGSEDFYLYRQPQLNEATWETKPRAGDW